ncbi:unnamed protein product [Schistocephalus solidus]|uniref:Uncharacterized protein n=1 Tax=Schistocephalus solidus TaxID=70667 RepID=A0A183TAV9_SCHSO|nr:unnamed protein product [Schistocephalus solidus]
MLLWLPLTGTQLPPVAPRSQALPSGHTLGNRHDRRAKQGSDGGGEFSYIFWSGRPKADRIDAGVAFAIRKDIVGRMPCLPQGINDHLMSLRLSLQETDLRPSSAPTPSQ